MHVHATNRRLQVAKNLNLNEKFLEDLCVHFCSSKGVLWTKHIFEAFKLRWGEGFVMFSDSCSMDFF